MSSEPRVCAVVATYRRPRELRRLLQSLAGEGPELTGVVVVDNGGDADTAAVLAAAPVPVQPVRPGRNLGCGGGVAQGFVTALRNAAITHLWQLDDDAEMRPGALGALARALAQADAVAAAPLVVNAEDRVCWFPGPLPVSGWRQIGREVVTPAEFRRRFGEAPLTWQWSPWTSLLVTRAAVDAVGLPRDDYWFQGEDIEYTLRLSHFGRCVLSPGAVCVHHATSAAGRRGFLKKRALLQNNAYTFLRLPHGRRATRYLPGNYARFLREEGFSARTLSAAAAAFWRGAVRGRPAGAPGCDGLRVEWNSLNER